MSNASLSYTDKRFIADIAYACAKQVIDAILETQGSLNNETQSAIVESHLKDLRYRLLMEIDRVR